MSMSRRRFVSSTAAGVVGASAALRPSTALGVQPSGSRPVAPSDRIRVASVGVGGMGRSNLTDFLRMKDVQVVAVCDVWAPNLQRAAKMAGSSAASADVQTFTDFRRILDMKDVDVVIVSPPDHWHAIPTILACEAGKDVYVEKPLSVTVAEGRKMVDAAVKHKRIVQMGTQQRSGAHYQEAVRLIREGKIGTITRVHTWNHGNSSPAGIGNPPDGAPPDGLDWDMWLGPAPKVPFNSNRFGFTFRWFWDYAGGMMTDWGVHHIDIVQWAMNVDAPLTAAASGGKYHLKDNRETPDTIEAVYEYPGFLMSYSNRMCNGRAINDHGYGIEFYGTDGTLFLDRAGYEIIPETTGQEKDPTPAYLSEMRDAKQPLEPWERPRRMRKGRTDYAQGEGSDQHAAHVRNFLDCVKSRRKPNSDIETGHKSTVTALLGNVALRSGRKIKWDPKTETTDSAEANKLLWREPRAPWKT
jgi:predicted dehydrogenase